MSHVVQRCPSCGVEHDACEDGACEACGTPLRAWCRRHGRDVGWLEGPACPRCAEDAARPRPAPAPRAAPPVPPPAPVRPPEPSRWPGRSPREILRGPLPPEAFETEAEAQDGLGHMLGQMIRTAVPAWLGGVLLGLVVGFVIGVNAWEVAWAVGKLLGLAGLMVGAVRALAGMVSPWSR